MPTTRDVTGALLLGGLRLSEVAYDPRVGTPAYVYDLDGIREGATDLRTAFEGAPHLIAYAVKANTAAPVLRVLAAEGAGADVVSGPELAVALGCGIRPESIVFSGVAKKAVEIDQAIFAGPGGIGAIQIESVEEIPRVEARAALAGRRARVSLRINPAVDFDAMGTHAHIATGHDEAKFGVPLGDVALAVEALRRAPHLDLVGISSHVGSQFTSVEPYILAARAVFEVARGLRASHAKTFRFVDTGGGFGIDYGAGCPVRPADFVRAVRAEQRAHGMDDLALYVEPGRALVAAHGVLVAEVLQSKVASAATAGGSERRWLMIDAGMNDLLRPALYQAVHRIVPLQAPAAGAPEAAQRVVGPVCESSDDFGSHVLPLAGVTAVAILDAGAYGFTMASRYNGRALPAEVFLAGGAIQCVSPRRAADEWVKERLAIGG